MRGLDLRRLRLNVAAAGLRDEGLRALELRPCRYLTELGLDVDENGATEVGSRAGFDEC